MKRLAIVLLLFAAAPVYSQPGQSPDLAQVFSGKTYPLTLKLKDLNSDWRRMTTSGPSEAGQYMQMLSAMFSGAAGNVYYTKGQTATFRSETYIIAYRVQTKAPDFAALMRGEGGRTPPEPLTPDNPLSLSLLNLQTIGSLNDIRPFNLERELAESANVSEESEKVHRASASPMSLSNLKSLGLALLMYAEDYDEVLPPMEDIVRVKELLLPYVRGEEVFFHPETRDAYLSNPALSGEKLSEFKNPAEIVAFHEPKPADDYTRGAVFLDGWAERINEHDWPVFKKASGIP